MRENRPYGLEGGETGLNGLPYPYAESRRLSAFQNPHRQAAGIFEFIGHRLCIQTA